MPTLMTVLEAIINFLKPQDIISLSSTCKLFYQLTNSDKIWAAVCAQKFGIKIRFTGGFTKKFYQNGMRMKLYKN